MVIIHVVGGFGNQLYCYALYEKFKSLGKEVKLDIGDYLPGAREPEKRALELPLLKNLSYEICTPKERFALTDDSRAFFCRVRRKLLGSKAKIYRENDRFDEKVFDLDEVYLDGYWNSEAYFSDITALLQEKQDLCRKNKKRRIGISAYQKKRLFRSFLHRQIPGYLYGEVLPPRFFLCEKDA